MAIKVSNETVITNERKGVLAGVDLDGLLSEKVNIPQSTFSSDPNINLEDGMLHYYSANENTTANANIRFNSTTSLNNVLPPGRAVTVTLVFEASVGRYMSGITIDGASRTVNWVGGEAPSEGGSSGVDIYTFNILKTGNNIYTVIGSQAKTSS